MKLDPLARATIITVLFIIYLCIIMVRQEIGLTIKSASLLLIADIWGIICIVEIIRYAYLNRKQ